MTDPVARHVKEAVKRFAGAVTVPIMQPIGAEILPVGTGTFLKFEGRLFIITAAHLFDGQQLNHFFVPSDPDDGKAIRLVGTIVRAKAHENVDIAVIEILDEPSRAMLGKAWQAITLDNVSVASDAGTFVLVGYPTAYQSARDGTVNYGVCTTFTHRIATPANARGVDESIDLFFAYSKVATSEEGESLNAPHLRGASGASVWEFRNPDCDGVWTPERSISVVGVQASTMDGEWFRATSWEVVRDALAFKDDSLRLAIESKEPNS